jgi:hypothetical protein
VSAVTTTWSRVAGRGRIGQRRQRRIGVDARQGEHSELWGARMTLGDYRARQPGWTSGSVSAEARPRTVSVFAVGHDVAQSLTALQM